MENIGSALNIDYNQLNVIELGSGDHSKVQLLFDQIPNETLSSINYFPVDISESAIRKSATSLCKKYPMISITGIVADFMHELITIPKKGRRLFCFLGSTIGNLSPAEVKDFMNLVGSEMNEGDYFLLGLDMVKDIKVLERAYNDSQNITAEFNKNCLSVINKVLDSNFNPDQFEHLAFFNRGEQRIEMHLKALESVSIVINQSSSKIFIEKNEMIHTENSYKFEEKDIELIGNWAGLETLNVFTDQEKWFSLVQFIKNN